MLNKYIRLDSKSSFVAEIARLYARRPSRLRWKRLDSIIRMLKNDDRTCDNFWWMLQAADAMLFELHMESLSGSLGR